MTLRKETLEKILGQLSQRERRVLELRYGLNGEHPRTLDEVGRAFNVTRERIRQIENQSLKKLRALADSQKLRDVALVERVCGLSRPREARGRHRASTGRSRVDSRSCRSPSLARRGLRVAPHPQCQRRPGAPG